MAVIQKTLFAKNLDRYAVLVNDTEPNSRYFKITELPDTFTGGKNAFLIAGSTELIADTKIQIELKDAAGNIIYHEPGEGYISSSLNGTPFITEYYEGVSKVVSVYIYPDTAYGPCTLTILGELSQYEDANGITIPVPSNWENQYNVKWTKTINVNPNLANTTRVRFYERPNVSIKEILSPIYRIENDIKINSGVSQSFADIKLSKLETFAGDVKRIKVFRTSEGDISDYDLIQDILVESKELLTSYGLTGSVVGQTGIITSETLKSFWNTGSLNAYLTSSRVESGVRLTGSGNFTYTSSLDIRSANTYELNFDAFYSSSTNSNLGIYLASGSTSSSIGTLYGISPTKNLLDTVIPFKISTDYPTASLYFSQSQGEWHLGNISLKLSQDTAFSPDEISFITTMPTVIGNETFNFKFEFYDVNNNYVPVAVTQSATFTGGVNVNNTLLLVSASASQSLAALAAVSSSISGTMTVYSSSASSSVNVLSGSVSGTIGRVSGSISSSIYSLSGSVSSSLTLTSGSIILLSGSFLQFTQSITSSLTSLSQSVSSSFFNVSGAINAATASLSSSMSASLSYQVYSASQYLDKFIFTDDKGKINSPPTASDPGLYLGSTYLGYYNGTGTSGWKTYMADNGNFYLTSSIVGGGLLAWNAAAATLQINGSINIQGGNAATTSSVSASINSATSSLSSSVATTTFTTATGLIAKPPTVLVGSTSGLYLGSTYLGYYDGSNWKTYMANNGNFYLSGTGTNGLTWNGSTLSITGTIKVSDGTEVTNATINGAAAGATALQNSDTGKSLGLTGGSVGGVTIGSNKIYVGTGTFNNTNTGFYVDSTGQMSLKDKLVWDGSSLSIKGTIKVSDGTEVTNATITGAASGATALQNSDTGKSLGLTGGSVGGVTIGSNKIYVGTGTYGNANTGFYVDSSGNMSLKDKLTWDGATLSITGNVVITGGSTKTAIDNAASAASSAQSTANSAASAASTAQTTADGKLSPGSAASDVNNNTTTISGGKIRTGLIQSNNFSGTGDGSGYSSAGMSIDLTGGGISAKNFRITAGGDAYFKGDISGASGTFSGTLSGATITGGTIRIGSGTSVFSADTNGIYLGNTTFANAPFRVSPSGVLTATNATISGNITATGGSIGGWQVDNIGQLIGSSSTGQIVLNPNAPNFNFLDSYGDTKLNLKIGALTNPESPNNVSFTINSNNASAYSQNTSGTDYVYGTTTSVYVPAAGTYTGNAKYNWGSSYIQYQTNSQFYGYLYISCYITILDSDGYAVGTTYVNSIDSFGPSDSGTVYGGVTYAYPSFSFPKAGTYTIKPTIEITRQVSSGYFDYTVSQQSQGSLTYNQAVSLSEISDYGMVIANDANDYITMNRQGYKINLKGTVYFSSQYTGQYSYCDGVWHPFSGNKNDLGTSGNRWRSVWSNNNLNVSDERLKNSIEDTDLGLEFVNKLKPKRFKYNESLTPRYHYGFVAQEISASLSEYGHSSSDVSFINTSSVEYTNEQIEELKTKPNWESVQRDIAYQEAGYMGLNYTELLSPMIKAIQELSDRVIYLESKISGSI